MDDFSWGQTCSVGGNAAAFANPDDDGETDYYDNGSNRKSRGGYDNANDEADSYIQDHLDWDKGSDEESDHDSNEQ